MHFQLSTIPRPDFPIVFVLALTFLLLPLLQIGHYYDSVVIPRQILLGLSSVIVLVLFVRPWRPRPFTFVWHPAIGVAVMFLGAAMLSLVWTFNTDTTLLSIIYVAPMVFLFFVLCQTTTTAHMQPLTNVIFLASCIAAVIGIQQYFHYNPFILPQVNVPASTFLNKNVAAQYFDLIVPLSLLGILYSPNKVFKYFSATTFAVCLAFILLARTRGSMLALAVGLLALLVLLASNKTLAKSFFAQVKLSYAPFVFGVLLTIAITLAPTSSSHVDKWDVGELYTNKAGRSVQTRLATYKNTLEMIKADPLLGSGYGTFARGFRPFAANPYPNPLVTESVSFKNTHNDPLQYLAELGIIGGSLPIIFFALIVIQGFKTVARVTDSNTQLLLMGLLLSVVTSAAHAMVSFPMRMPTSGGLFWCLCGMILAIAFRYNTAGKSVTFPRFSRHVVTGVAAVLIALALYVVPPFLKGNYHLKAAALFFSYEECDKATAAIERAFAHIPWDVTTLKKYALIYTVCPASNHKKFSAMNNVISNHHSYPLAYLTRANLFLKARDFDSAADDFYRVVELVPHRASGYLGLALVATHKHKPEKSRDFLRIARELEPNNPEVKKVQRAVEGNKYIRDP